MKWLLDNLFALISFVVLVIGWAISLIKSREKTTATLDRHKELIDELRGDLDKEKEQNKQNYIKQDEKLEEVIASFNARLDKIDEMNNSINSLKTDIEVIKGDISHIKEDYKELKEDVRDLKNKVSK